MTDDFGVGDYDTPTGHIVPAPMDCMSCGVCLGNCPTYLLSQDEKEGPRQRIRTLSKLVVEKSEVDDEAIVHLNNCIQCRACELVCPSQMNYSELFDKAQYKLLDQQDKGFYAKLALDWVADKKKLKSLMPLLLFYKLSGVQWLFRKLGLLKLLKLHIAEKLARLPELKPLKSSYPTNTQVKGKVALFTGCIAEHFDRKTLDASIKVLNALGYEVSIPVRQVCCGAIHYHNGEPEAAKELMQQNRSGFNHQEFEAIIYCVTGCGSQLQEYQLVLELDDNDSAFTAPLFEVSDFILGHWDDTLSINPLSAKVAVHEPCSQRNVLKTQQAVYDLLGKIPELKVEALEENNICCGAGGSYMLSHPHTAQTLRDNKWQHIFNSGADYVVTSNIGCDMHLQTFEFKNHPVEFKHPVTILADQLYT